MRAIMGVMSAMATAIGLWGTAPSAQAGGQPGDFDLYVLSLSWSPEYCATPSANRSQCAPGRDLGLVVHGLWPQYAASRDGADWPSSCGTNNAGGVPKQDITDVFPTEGLFRHEWREHGVCSGLSPTDYLVLTGRLRNAVHLPDMLQQATTDRRVGAEQLRRALLAANPQLPPEAMVLDCKGNRLAEIRVCFARQPAGTFRACPAEMLADDVKDCPRQIRLRAAP